MNGIFTQGLAQCACSIVLHVRTRVHLPTNWVEAMTRTEAGRRARTGSSIGSSVNASVPMTKPGSVSAMRSSSPPLKPPALSSAATLGVSRDSSSSVTSSFSAMPACSLTNAIAASMPPSLSTRLQQQSGDVRYGAARS
jgi:hypothetical protein